jgi:hypothetical protein
MIDFAAGHKVHRLPLTLFVGREKECCCNIALIMEDDAIVKTKTFRKALCRIINELPENFDGRKFSLYNARKKDCLRTQFATSDKLFHEVRRFTTGRSVW